jgi:hypothetical protein
MSAPSPEHEERVRVLEAVAMLAGFTGAIAFNPPLEPDVFRVDFKRHRVFVGDAKATETAGSHATKARLMRYARATLSWCAGGADAVLAVAHSQPHHSHEWLDALEEVVARAGLWPSAAGTSLLDQGCVLAWVEVPRILTARHGSSPAPVRVHLDGIDREAVGSSADRRSSLSSGH